MSRARLRRNVIVIDTNIAEIRNGTRALLEQADRHFRDIDREVTNLNSIVSSIPSDARNKSLQVTISDLSSTPLADSRFETTLRKINRSLTQLSININRVDRTWSTQTARVRGDIDRLRGLANSYRGFIGSGKVSLSSRDFLRQFGDFVRATQVTRNALLLGLMQRAEEMAGLNNTCAYSPDPVNLSTGNFIYEKKDIETFGSFPLKYVRFYNALDLSSGPAGKNWRHSFEVSLEQEENGDLFIYFQDGHLERYTYTKDGFKSPIGSTSTLEVLTEGFLLTTKEKESYLFDRYGTYTSFIDRLGNKTHISYCDRGFIKKVENLSSALHFETNHSGNIISIKDCLGRKVSYEYKGGEGVLLSGVRDMQENSYTYKYDLHERLTHIINACEQTQVTNTYDEEYRVVRQDFFDRGVAHYSYCKESRETTLIEQNKNEIVYGHDERLRNTSITYSDGKELITYDKDDNKTSLTDKLGNTTYFSYDERANLTEVKDPLNNITKIIYGKKDLPTSITAANGATVSFDYDSLGNLSAITDPEGRKVETEINTFKVPTKITLPTGAITLITSDDRANITSIKNPDGGVAHLKYNELNQVSKITNPLNHSTHFEYNKAGRVTCITNALGERQHFEYSENNQVSLIRDFCGKITTLKYNAANKVTEITEAGLTTLYSYDKMWNIDKVTLSTGAEIHYSYNKLNRLVKITDEQGGEIHFTHDACGNVTSQVDQNENTTHFEYDALSRPIKRIDALGSVTRAKYNEMDKVTKLIDALGNVQTFDYNLAGELISATDKLGNTTTYTYCALGEVSTVTDAIGNTTTIERDRSGRIAKITDALGNEQLFEHDLGGNLIKATDALGNVTSAKYDALDRLTCLTHSDNSFREITYDKANNIASICDEARNITKYSHDAFGNLTCVTDALGNITKYSYDALSELTEITKFVGSAKEPLTVTYERDLRGLITAEIDEVGKAIDYSYDSAGNLIAKTDKCGSVTSQVFNELNQLTAVVYPDGREIAFSYNPLGQLTEFSDHLGKTTLELDALGKVLSVTNHLGEKVNYSYNALGLRESIQYLDGTSANYSYDPLGRLNQVKDNLGNITNYSYDALNRLLEKALPNGTTTSHTYNELGRLTELSTLQGSEVLDKLTYTHDPLGNITGIEKQRVGIEADSGSFSYSYDALSRLTEVKSPQGTHAYSYDSLGNRVSAGINGKVTTYSYNSLNQLIQEVSPNTDKSFEYDLSGNLSKVFESDNLTSEYHFNTQGFLERATTPKGTVQHSYNALGKRVSSTTEAAGHTSVQTDYLLDLTRPYHDLLATTTNDATSHFIWGEQDVVSTQSDSETNYYTHDHLLSPLRLIGHDGVSAEALSFDEFGVFTTNTPNSTNPFGYTGYQQDQVSELYFAQARYYSPGAARFISADLLKGSAVNPQSQNRYAHCLANPLVYVDRDGLSPTFPNMQTSVHGGGSSGLPGASSHVTFQCNDARKESFHNSSFVGQHITGVQNNVYIQNTPNEKFKGVTHAGGNIIVGITNTNIATGATSTGLQINSPSFPASWINSNASSGVNASLGIEFSNSRAYIVGILHHPTTGATGAQSLFVGRDGFGSTATMPGAKAAARLGINLEGKIAAVTTQKNSWPTLPTPDRSWVPSAEQIRIWGAMALAGVTAAGARLADWATRMTFPPIPNPIELFPELFPELHEGELIAQANCFDGGA